MKTLKISADNEISIIDVNFDEFQTVLHALYQLLEKNIKESESVTPRDLMHSMVEDVVQKESEMNKA